MKRVEEQALNGKLTMVIAAFLVGLPACADFARADIPVPQPRTVWARDSQPSNQSIAYAGVCLSAAIVAAGLIVARWPAGGSRLGLMATGLVTALGVLIVAVGALAAMHQAERDRAAWKQWELDETNRRANWRPPPQFRDDGTPPSAAPSPE